MTETLSRPGRSTSSRSEPAPAPRPRLAAGLMAAAWAGCAGLVACAVPVLLVWVADARSGSPATAALRTAGQVWLVAHGAALHVPGGMLGLTPLGLLVVPLLLLLRAAGHAARLCQVRTLREAARLTAAIAVPYGVLAAVVAAACATRDVHPVPWQALLAGWVVGGVGALAGVLRAAELWTAVPPKVPPRATRLVIGTGAALLLLLGAGGLLAGASLAAHLGRADNLVASLAPGAVGGVTLLVLGLSLVPNAAVWAVAWLAGPGFSVGAATAVGPFGTSLGAVPSVPLLAALPGPVPVWVALVALCVPVGAGALAGTIVLRRIADSSHWLVVAREAALVGPVAGVLAGGAGWLSGGSVGGQRLTDVGPSPWLLGLSLAVEVGVGAAAASTAIVFVRRRFSRE